MKRNGKLKFFIVLALIVILSAFNIFGISSQWGDVTSIYVKSIQDINWGLDIGGGVQAVFAATSTSGEEITKGDINKTETIMKKRLAALGVTEYEINTDYTNNSVVLRFPNSYDASETISVVSDAGELKFVSGTDTDSTTGLPTGDTIITREHVKSAKVKSGYADSSDSTLYYFVNVTLTDEGYQLMSEATAAMVEEGGGTISVWFDNTNIYSPKIEEEVSSGEIFVYSITDEEKANLLAEEINIGQLPVALSSSYTNISAALGVQARKTIAIAVVAILLVVAAYIIFKYRYLGAVACIALLGQISFILILITGFFSPFPNFTLSFPALAGIAVSLIVGLTYQITTINNISEELGKERTLAGSIKSAQKRGFSSVLHSNILLILISIVLVGLFGSGWFSDVFAPLTFMLDTVTDGAVYSFAYTLGIGIICNLLAIGASRIMLSGLSTFDRFQDTKFYGGAK